MEYGPGPSVQAFGAWAGSGEACGSAKPMDDNPRGQGTPQNQGKNL